MLRNWFIARVLRVSLSFLVVYASMYAQTLPAEAAPKGSAMLGEMIGVISGTVEDEAGNPLEHMPVSLDGSSSGQSACTNENGEFQFTGVETEVNWRVQVFPFSPINSCGGSLSYAHQYYNQKNTWSTADLIWLPTDQPVRDDIHFQLVPGGGIAGQIHDELGAAVNDICIGVYPDVTSSSALANYYVTSEDGAFEIYGVPAGSAYVRTHTNCGTPDEVLDEWYAAGGSTLDSSQASAVTIMPGVMTTGIDFQLDQAGIVEGTVTVSGTGAVISGASVSIGDATFGGGGSFTTTDNNGNYTFHHVIPGYHSITVSAEGYGKTYYGGYDDLHRSLFLVEGGSTVDIDIPMEVEATATGCVHQKDGVTPIPNARLIGHPSHGGSTLYATAGDNGCYQLGGFATGDYLIYASSPGFQTLYYDQKLEWGTATVLHMVSGQNKADINFSLPLAGSVSGRILRADGTVVSDQRIVVDAMGTTPDTSVVRAEVSRVDGSYRIDGLAPGIYKVGVNVMYAPGLVGEYYPNRRLSAEAQTLVVRAGENVPGINFDLEQDAPISGRLLDGDSGLPINVQDAYINVYDLNFNSRASATVLPDGTFVVRGLEPGAYYVRFKVPGYGRVFYGGSLDPANGQVVTTTTPGTEVDLGDIELQPGITLTGHVYAEDGHTPVEGASVVLITTFYYYFGWPATTDENGAFSMSDLPVGDYVIEAAATGYGKEYYPQGDTWTNAITAPFTIANDHPGAVDISLEPAGVITGSVLDEDGLPINDATIHVKAVGITNGSNEAEAQVMSDGTYTLSGLRPGAYEVLANNRYTAAYSSVYYDGQPVSEAATAFVIGEGFMSYSGVDFQLIRTAYTFTDETAETSLTYSDPSNTEMETVVEIPQNAVEEPTLFVYTPTDLAETEAGFEFAGVGFNLNAYQDGAFVEDFQFGEPARVELHYDAASLGGVEEENLRLMYYNLDEQEWEDAACGSYERHPEADWLAVPICHLSDFGLFEVQYLSFIPHIRLAR